MKWTILIDGEVSCITSHPESVIADLEFHFDIFSESWCGETHQVYILTEEQSEPVCHLTLS